MKEFAAALQQIPSTKLFLMHPQNRRLIEGFSGRTYYEADQLKKVYAFAVMTAIQFFGAVSGLILAFDFVRNNYSWIWLLAFAPIFTTGVMMLCYFEFDFQRRLRKFGTAIPGRIVDFKISDGDSTTAIATYEFITPDGETTKARTKELPYCYDSHFYISRSHRRFTLLPERIAPEMGDRGIVLCLTDRRQNTYTVVSEIL